MKKIIYVLILYFFFIQTYASNEEFFNWDITIKELRENIKNLKEEKELLNQKSKEILKEYGSITSFLEETIKQKDIENIKQNINIFLERRNIIEENIRDNIKKLKDTSKLKEELLKNQIDFYKSLVKYIKKEKRKNFIEYVKVNLEAIKQNKDLTENIIIKENLLEKKVNILKEKIEENKKNLINDLNNIIIHKLTEKIEEIQNDEKYQNLDIKTKNWIYNNFLNQIETKINEIKNSSILENFKSIKINSLESLKNEIKTKLNN